LLPDLVPYINADEIAKVLPMGASNRRDLEASRLLLARWDDLADAGENFAIETTLSSRSLAPRVQRLLQRGYEFHLMFFWLKNADLAVQRVAERVRQGGHNIPEETIRRRYVAGINNLFELYMPLADTWRVFDNNVKGATRPVAWGGRNENTIISDADTWARIKAGRRNG